MNNWLAAISKVGFPIVVALIVLGMWAGFVPSPMLSTMARSEAALARSEALVREHVRMAAGSPRLLRLICRNTAKNDSERSACDWGE